MVAISSKWIFIIYKKIVFEDLTFFNPLANVFPIIFFSIIPSSFNINFPGRTVIDIFIEIVYTFKGLLISSPVQFIWDRKILITFVISWVPVMPWNLLGKSLQFGIVLEDFTPKFMIFLIVKVFVVRIDSIQNLLATFEYLMG